MPHAPACHWQWLPLISATVTSGLRYATIASLACEAGKLLVTVNGRDFLFGKRAVRLKSNSNRNSTRLIHRCPAGLNPQQASSRFGREPRPSSVPYSHHHDAGKPGICRGHCQRPGATKPPGGICQVFSDKCHSKSISAAPPYHPRVSPSARGSVRPPAPGNPRPRV